MEQRCVTESHPDYAWLSSDTKNLKGNTSRNALQLPLPKLGLIVPQSATRTILIYYQWRLPTESTLYKYMVLGILL